MPYFYLSSLLEFMSSRKVYMVISGAKWGDLMERFSSLYIGCVLGTCWGIARTSVGAS